MKQSLSQFHDIRGLRYHVRTWGSPGAPRLFLLHGWMDVSASFQFLVDGFRREWHVIAPDWRGFGLSGSDGHGYWFADYYADLIITSVALDALGGPNGLNVTCIGPQRDASGKACPVDVKTGMPWTGRPVA